MPFRNDLFSLMVAATVVFVSLSFFNWRPSSQANQGTLPPARVEDAYRANNIGIALLEQFKFKEAAESFRQAINLAPKLAIPYLNLGIALFNIPETEEARNAVKKALELMPDSPRPHYLLGIIAKKQNNTEEAIAAFQQVLHSDAKDVGTNVNLAQLYLQQKKYAAAQALLRAALSEEPYNTTATYNLALALLRNGQRDEGQAMMQQFQRLRDSNYSTAIGQNYLEQGAYAEALASTGAEADLVDTKTPNVTFVDGTERSFPGLTREKADNKLVKAGPRTLLGLPMSPQEWEQRKNEIVSAFSGDLCPIDFDGDGDLDLLEVTPNSLRLFRNDGGEFVDVTEGSGLTNMPANSICLRAIAGDFDNDGKTDLFVLRYGTSSLYKNEGGGKFRDVTAEAGIPAYPFLALSVAFVDIDHDGDLDIFIAGFADLNLSAASRAKTSITFPGDFANSPNLLLRNDGNGKFTDITREAQVATSAGHAVAVVPTDFNNHRDIDLFIVNYGEAPTLYSNLRDGTFRDVAREVGLKEKGPFTCVAAGDFNKDGYTDFFLGRTDAAGVFAISDGKEHFNLTPAPEGTADASAAQFLDYDNDGLLDLVLFAQGRLRVFRNVGSRFVEVTKTALAPELNAAFQSAGPLPSNFAFASADFDNDGDLDLLTSRGGQIKIYRNDGGNNHASARLQLAGRFANRNGIGTKIEILSGSLRQKLETYSASPAPAPASLIFGLGKRSAVDAVRLLWPSGNVQAELEIAAAKQSARNSAPVTKITEVDRKPSSCPFLYTWNGERFEFITDFMGGGEYGHLESPGVTNIPDSDECVRIRGDQLKPLHGRYEIRVTNELEEVSFIDRLQLVVIAHPENTEVYPNEGLVNPPRPPFRLYSTQGAHPPVKATDDKGNDVLPQISKLDRQFVDTFDLNPIRGYAADHTLTLDLGKSQAQRTLLLFTGWTDYAFSTDTLAASQSGLELKPPVIQVKDGSGNWQTIRTAITFPIGRPQTVPVDLTGKFLSRSREVRVVTNMRIYWDEILVDESDGAAPVTLTRLEATTANLRQRGFSAIVTPDGKEPYSYDYHHLSTMASWKYFVGRYTREGDVRELLAKSDDRFVVGMPGDEIALSFDATKVPPLKSGWKYTFLLYVDGFSKEMDINSASPHTVEPMPYHSMLRLPDEHRLASRAHRDYIERYNTRIVKSEMPRIETGLLEKLSQK